MSTSLITARVCRCLTFSCAFPSCYLQFLILCLSYMKYRIVRKNARISQPVRVTFYWDAINMNALDGYRRCWILLDGPYASYRGILITYPPSYSNKPRWCNGNTTARRHFSLEEPLWGPAAIQVRLLALGYLLHPSSTQSLLVVIVWCFAQLK